MKTLSCWVMMIGAVGCGGVTSPGHPGADGGTPSYARCDGPGQCEALVPGCCGVCGAPGLGDVVGVNSDQRDQMKAATCGDPNPTCPKCATQIEPNLVAFCDSGRCTPLDIRTDPVSSCHSDSDCMLRTAACCESCAPNAFELVAIAKQEATRYQSEVCRTDQACPACAPIYPAGWVAACGEGGHCQVVQKTNVCPADPPVSGEACAVDATVTCEYGDDVRPGCRMHATCPNGAWQIAVSGCPPLPGPGESGCPASPPESGSSCASDGLVCDMGNETLCVCSACSGPCSQFPYWACSAPPSTPGCPPRAPALGSACTSEGLVCTYGVMCVAPISAGRRCRDGAWVDEPLACPV